MWLEQHSLFGPLIRFLKSLPILIVALIAIPFVSPRLTRWLVEPLLPTGQFSEEEGSVSEINELKAQIARLKQENQNHKVLLDKLKALEVEETHALTWARNLGHSPQLYRRGLVLSYPPQENKSVLNASVVYKNNLIGIIDNEHKKWCHVRLVADPEFAVAVNIISPDGENEPLEGWPQGICGGQIGVGGGSEVVVRNIDNTRFKDIKKGHLVVTSSYDFKTQKGLLVGEIKDIKEGNLFLHLPVKLAVNPRDKAVFSILPPLYNPFETPKDSDSQKKKKAK